MLMYEFDKYIYVPVSLSVLVEKKIFNLLNGNFLSCEISNRIFESVFANKNKTFIIDLKEIYLGDSRCFSELKELQSGNENNVIFVNFNDIIKDYLINDCMGYLFYNKEFEIIGSEKSILYFTNYIKSVSRIDDDLSEYISSKINENIYDKEQHLSSSNIYVNKYIDIKQILLYPNIYYLILFELSLLIKKTFDDFSKLICCSYTGSIVSTILGQLLNKEVIYLMNLGPSISYNNVDMISLIKKNDKYLFVGDMICLGTEYNLTQTIAKLNHADLVGAACIIKYLSPAYACKVASLVEIFDGDKFEYNVIIKKMDKP